MENENKQTNPLPTCAINPQNADDCHCRKGQCIHTRFTLAVIAVCLSCFTGFFTTPLALAALIISLHAQNQIAQGRTQEAARSAFWAGLFGWVTVIIAVLPVLAILFFGGAILAGLTAFFSAM